MPTDNYSMRMDSLKKRIREALEELDEPTSKKVSEWTKENKNIEIAPKGVGLYAKRPQD